MNFTDPFFIGAMVFFVLCAVLWFWGAYKQDQKTTAEAWEDLGEACEELKTAFLKSIPASEGAAKAFTSLAEAVEDLGDAFTQMKNRRG